MFEFKKGSTLPMLTIVVCMLGLALSFTNCGEFGANSSDVELQSLFDGGKFLKTTYYDSNGDAQEQLIPYTLDGTNVMAYGDTLVGTSDKMKSGDFIQTPQIDSLSRRSQINARQKISTAGMMQAVNKGGYTGSIHKDSAGKRILFYHWRGSSAGRLKGISAGMKAKLQAEIDQMNAELKSKNVNLEFKNARRNTHNSSLKIIVISELKSSDSLSVLYSYLRGAKSNPEISFRPGFSNEYMGSWLRKWFMVQLGFVRPFFTNKRSDYYNVNLDNLTEKGRELLGKSSYNFNVGADTSFFSTDSVLTEHSCWRNDSRSCKVRTTSSADLSFTLKNGNKKFIQSTFSDSDLRSMRSVYGTINAQGQAVEIVNKIVGVYVSPFGELNAIGYACRPDSNETVNVVMSRSIDNRSWTYGQIKFAANQNILPKGEIPEECTDANGNHKTNVSFHIKGTVRSLGLFMNGKAVDYGWFRAAIDKESLDSNSHKVIVGNHFHNNSAAATRFYHGLYDRTKFNQNNVISYFWTMYNNDSSSTNLKRCGIKITDYNNVPNSVREVADSTYNRAKPQGWCKPYILERLFGFTKKNGGSTSSGGGSTTNAPADTPVCSASVRDDDGDGWGFENGKSCTMPDGATSTNTVSNSQLANFSGFFSPNVSCKTANGYSYRFVNHYTSQDHLNTYIHYYNGAGCVDANAFAVVENKWDVSHHGIRANEGFKVGFKPTQKNLAILTEVDEIPVRWWNSCKDRLQKNVPVNVMGTDCAFEAMTTLNIVKGDTLYVSSSAEIFNDRAADGFPKIINRNEPQGRVSNCNVSNGLGVKFHDGVCKPIKCSSGYKIDGNSCFQGSGGSVTAERPTCSESIVDTNGDGWGFENNVSCRMPASLENPGTIPNCTDDNSDPDGDGWGFENGKSCKVQETSVSGTTPEPTEPTGPAICSDSSSDPDGDGWGFENGKSCKVQGTSGSGTTPEPTPEPEPTGPAICSDSSSDPDGDGWGFENGKSCKVQGTSGSGTTPEPTPEPEPTGPAICSDSSSDPDGDGWGFENGKSCKVQGTSGSGTTPEPTPEPEPTGPAICSDSSSDPDGDGWGFENGKSCKVQGTSGSGTTPEPTPEPEPTGPAICSDSSSDPDGDGWGFENGKSCKVDQSTAGSGTAASTSAGNIYDKPVIYAKFYKDFIFIEAGKPVCEIKSNKENEIKRLAESKGMFQESNSRNDLRSKLGVNNLVKVNCGSNGTKTEDQIISILNDGRTPASSTSSSTTTPASSGKLVCASASSDPDGDGYGWENGKSCVVDKNKGSGNSSSNNCGNNEVDIGNSCMKKLSGAYVGGCYKYPTVNMSFYMVYDYISHTKLKTYYINFSGPDCDISKAVELKIEEATLTHRGIRENVGFKLDFRNDKTEGVMLPAAQVPNSYCGNNNVKHGVKYRLRDKSCIRPTLKSLHAIKDNKLFLPEGLLKDVASDGYPKNINERFDNNRKAERCTVNNGSGWKMGGRCVVFTCNSGKYDGYSCASSSSGGGAVDANGRPICASADSDPDGDGWGYENGKSCVVQK